MIIRNKKSNQYTNVPFDIIMDKRVGIKELGLWVQLYSLPDDWSFSIEGLATLRRDGTASISSSVKALEDLGYLKRVQRRNENGFFEGYDWYIYESPEIKRVPEHPYFYASRDSELTGSE